MSAAAAIGLIGIGAVSGFSSGLLGSGGALLTLTLLAIAGQNAHTAVGTTLVYTLVIGAWAVVAHHHEHRFSPRLALALGVPAAVTAVAGAGLSEAVPDRVLTLGVAVLTGATALVFAAGGSRRAGDQEGGTGTEGFRATPAVLAGAAGGGAGIGFLKGLFGVGGGFLLVPYLVVVLRAPTRLAVACSLFAGLPGGLAGGITHLALGNVDLAVLALLLVGGLTCTWLGALTASLLSGATIRRLFIGLLATSCFTLLAVGQ